VAPQVDYEVDGVRHVFRLDKDAVSIGRGPDNDMVIQDHSISRHHARLLRQEGAWHVTDLGSKNGTHVVDRPDTKAALQDGDVVMLGKFPVTFHDQRVSGIALGQPVELRADEASGTLFQPARDFSALVGTAPGAVRDPTAEVDRLHKLLAVLSQVSGALLGSKSLDELLNYMIDLVFQHLPAERAFVMLWDEKKQQLVERIARQRQAAEGGQAPTIRVSRTIADKVCKDRMGVITTDAQSDARFAGGASIMAMGIRSAMAAPLGHGETVEGLIYVDTPFHVKAFDAFDLDLLSALGNHAAIAIQQARLQESIVSERLSRQRLERYHSPAVVERIRKGGLTGETLAADEREVTVLFADVVGFTSRCERLEPREVAAFLNRCFSRMADMIFRYEGTLDKFIGDCVMAVFGAPLEQPDHALRAVATAVDIRAAIEELNEELDEGERVQFRVGLNSGRVVAGDIGSVRRSDYTVLGATVNLASRLESSVARPGQIVVSDATNDAIAPWFETRFVTEAQPKGISRVVRCYEVIGRRPGVALELAPAAAAAR
jgi:adenylate cyclase